MYSYLIRAIFLKVDATFWWCLQKIPCCSFPVQNYPVSLKNTPTTTTTPIPNVLFNWVLYVRTRETQGLFRPALEISSEVVFFFKKKEQSVMQHLLKRSQWNEIISHVFKRTSNVSDASPFTFVILLLRYSI